MANCLGVIPVSAWADFGGNSVATWRGAQPYKLSGSANLYGQLVTRTAATLGSTTDVIVGVQVEQDS
jgi:hypothetical protein